MSMGHGAWEKFFIRASEFKSVWCHPCIRVQNPCGAEKLVCKINLEFRLQQVEFSAMILYLWVTIS